MYLLANGHDPPNDQPLSTISAEDQANLKTGPVDGG